MALGWPAILGGVLLLVVVIVAWKMLKLAFKVALIVAAAALLFFGLRWAGFL